jgi:hypothetical protein
MKRLGFDPWLILTCKTWSKKPASQAHGNAKGNRFLVTASRFIQAGNVLQAADPIWKQALLDWCFSRPNTSPTCTMTTLRSRLPPYRKPEAIQQALQNKEKTQSCHHPLHTG